MIEVGDQGADFFHGDPELIDLTPKPLLYQMHSHSWFSSTRVRSLGARTMELLRPAILVDAPGSKGLIRLA